MMPLNISKLHNIKKSYIYKILTWITIFILNLLEYFNMKIQKPKIAIVSPILKDSYNLVVDEENFVSDKENFVDDNDNDDDDENCIYDERYYKQFILKNIHIKKNKYTYSIKIKND